MGNLQQSAERRIVPVIVDEFVRAVPANTEPMLNIGTACSPGLDPRLTILQKRDDAFESEFPRGFPGERQWSLWSRLLGMRHISVILSNYTMVIQRGIPRGSDDLEGAHEEGLT